MKKVISYLIATMMVFTMIPYTVFAADTGTSTADNSISLSLKSWVNPDYRGLLNEEDLYSGGEPFVPYSSETTYLESVKEGGTLLREYMVNRVDSFMLNYKISIDEANSQGDAWLQNIWDGMFEEACKHTGSPVEGDYLRKSYGGFTFGEIGFTYDNKYFYVEIPVTATFYTDYDQEEELTAAVDKLLDEIITDGMSDYEKVKAIYDYMTANIVYDYENLNDSSYRLKFTAYAAMINKTSVCQGYANLFYRLALECGIDSRIITGIANDGGHAWNIVKLGSKYYLVDATWDSAYVQAGLDYEYFLRAAYSDHTTDEEYLTSEFMAAYPISGTDYVPGQESEGDSNSGNEGEQGGSENTDPEAPVEPEDPSEPEEPAKCTHAKRKIVDAVAATCTQTGLKEGAVCADCGEILIKQEIVNALGHDVIKHNEKAPTCIEGGWEAYETCSRCEYNTYQDVKPTGHTPGAEATCTSAQICTVCSEELTPALGHNYSNWNITEDATCTTEGAKECKCSRCGHKLFEVIGTEAHMFTKKTVKPTCTSFGYSQMVCSGCGLTGAKSDYTAPTGHTPGAEATCTSAKICTVCGEELTPALGHTAEIKTTKATFEDDGYIIKSCKNCGELLSKTPIPKIKTSILQTIKYVYDGKNKKPAVTVKDLNDKILKQGTDYEVKYINAAGKTVTKPVNVGTYRAVVTFINNYYGNVYLKYTVNPKSTTINKLTKPAKKQIKVTWKKQTAQVTGYEIQYSTSKNFTKKTTKTLKVKKYKTNTATIKKLKAKKKYWVKIRTYKIVSGKTYYSTWSKAKYIKTK